MAGPNETVLASGGAGMRSSMGRGAAGRVRARQGGRRPVSSGHAARGPHVGAGSPDGPSADANRADRRGRGHLAQSAGRRPGLGAAGHRVAIRRQPAAPGQPVAPARPARPRRTLGPAGPPERRQRGVPGPRGRAGPAGQRRRRPYPSDLGSGHRGAAGGAKGHQGWINAVNAVCPGGTCWPAAAATVPFGPGIRPLGSSRRC